MEEDEICNCEMKLRENPMHHKEKVYIGCGAGFRGDRPLGALKLLQRVPQLDYLVIECLAERTLAERYQIMMAGGDGFDSRILEWMSLLLPLAVEREVCIITNMGAMDPLGAQEQVLNLASNIGLSVTVAVALESSPPTSGTSASSCLNPNPVADVSVLYELRIWSELLNSVSPSVDISIEDCVNYESSQGDVPHPHPVKNLDIKGSSTYLGAAPIVQCLEKYKPHVIITSRVADAALFLAPMIYELGWNWNDFRELAQGVLAGHLLECGCQLTGGYYMHPGDKNRDLSLEQLLDLSLPFAEVSFDGTVYVAKAEKSGGILNFGTCAQQLLYEIGDPSAYVTPDVVADFQDVSFRALSKNKVLCIGARPSSGNFPNKLLRLVPKDCGWKGWGEISYGGYACVKRAEAAGFLVKSWTKERIPDIEDHIMSYVIGVDSLKASSTDERNSCVKHATDIRLRMDGLFDSEDHAFHFVKEFEALYTNGPAGGGGISIGWKKEIILQKELVTRDCVFWRASAKCSATSESRKTHSLASCMTFKSSLSRDDASADITSMSIPIPLVDPQHPAPSGQTIPLYHVAHSRAGDKGDDLNFSIIPHCLQDIDRLKSIITPSWVKQVVSSLFSSFSTADCDSRKKENDWFDEHVTVEIYEAKGISSLNVVVRNVLDGGVNCSRRIDRHGKTISDLILCQNVVLPPRGF